MAAAHSSGGGRLRLFAILALLAAFTLLVGAHRAAADAAPTTATLIASPTTVVAGQPVTLTVTVTGTAGAPTGSVDFFNNTSSGRVLLNTYPDTSALLTPTGPNTSQATWVWYPAYGDYLVSAFYSSGDFATYMNSTSNTVAVSAGSAAPHSTKLDLTMDPTTIQVGGTVSFKAVVSETDGPMIPTGTVVFSASPNTNPSSQTTLGQVTLDANGVATLQDVGGWAFAGTYTVDATYSGDSNDSPVGSSLTFDVTPGVDTTVHTTTTVTATPSQIAAGDSVTLAAHVTQVGNPTPPPAGDNVDFRSTSIYGSQVELGQAPLDANGDATLVVTFAHAADYSITASYVGDITLHILGSSGITAVTVSGPQPTTTTYTGAASVNRGSQATLAASLKDLNSAAVAGEKITLQIGASGETCSALTDASGVASCSVVVNDAAGDYAVHATFAGDANYLASSDSGTLHVVAPEPTSLTYTGPTDALGGAPVTLSFVLKDTATSATLGGQTVSISLNGTTVSATTDANGVASVAATAPAAAQTYTVGASFAGATGFSGSTGSGSLSVHVLATTLTYVGDTSANGGGAATIAFLLKDAKGNALANQPVSLALDGATYPATTNDSGVASASVLAPAVAGTYTVDGSFAGAPGYLASTGSGSLKVTMVPTTTAYNGDTQTVVGAHATLAATLVESGTNAPLLGRTITLKFGGETCDATTDANGHGSCTVLVGDVPGSYKVTATFAGDAGHIGSSGAGTIVVAQAPTTTVDNVSGAFLAGSPLVLSATLSANGGPLGGKTLSFTFGTATCTGVTGDNGVASCQITVPGPTGPVTPTPTASFAGDVSYKSSSGSSPALVYGLAPGGGSFVVGDKTASGSVNFWGSQWWKQNVLSAGDAQAVDPGAFKGYAASPGNPQCGGTWTTAPGNSTPPPNAPLPAYMAVAVTSQNHKSGSTLSGNIVHVVVVKTDAGYAGNPGHDGTGTVVATVC